MGSILEEYRKRHGMTCVCPVNEGVLFFEEDNLPAIIATTSSFTKSESVCPSCPLNPEGITLELYCLRPYPVLKRMFVHTHMPPDADLVDYIQKHTGRQYEPYVSKGSRDQERWLWEFFKLSNPFKQQSSLVKTWGRIMDKQKQAINSGELSPELIWLNEAFNVARQCPKVFQVYYNDLYISCMVKRDYILSGEQC